MRTIWLKGHSSHTQKQEQRVMFHGPGSGSHAAQRTATEHSRHARREPLSSDSEADYARCRLASNCKRRIATEHSPDISRELDPDIRLQKSGTHDTVRIKAHHSRTPDIGIGIRISMPTYFISQDYKTASYRADDILPFPLVMRVTYCLL